MSRRIDVLRGGVPGAALDAALSRVLLDAVARGERGECLRLWRPADALACSAMDRRNAGFAAALEVARRRGFEPFLRLAGGHAAIYTRESLAFAWSVPAREAREGVRARFEELAEAVSAALRGLGVDARVGSVPGEWCPGDHSVNAGGRVKLMGVGQRLVHGAAHVGGVIVVRESARTRGVLAPVYAALRLPFDPGRVGSVEDEAAGASCEGVGEVLLAQLARRHALRDAELEPELLERAQRLEHRQRAELPGVEAPTARLDPASGGA